MLNILSCVHWSSVCLLWRRLFVFDIESYELFVYFWRLILCQLQKFANSLSHSVDYLFVLSMVSFALQKLLSLISSHLVIFVSITLGDKSEKILLQHISECSAFVFLYRALLRLSIRMSLCGVGTWSVMFIIICLVSRRVSGTQQVHSKYLMTYIHILGWHSRSLTMGRSLIYHLPDLVNPV